MAGTLGNTFEDEREFRELSFKWSIAWDTKNCSAFVAIAAPEVVADYSDFPALNRVSRVKPEVFFQQSFGSIDHGLGHPDLKTQHLLGASLFTRISETEAKGSWQARAWHTRTFEDGRVGNWDSSSFLEFTYVKIDGVWKIGGWRPNTVLASVGKHSDVLDTP